MNRMTRAVLTAVFAVLLVTGLIAPAAFPDAHTPAFAEHLLASEAPSEPTAKATPAPAAKKSKRKNTARPVTEAPTAVPTAEPTAEPTPEPTPTPFANGAVGDDVTALQKQLGIRGFFTGNADGIFGPMTESAFKSYQQYRYDQYKAAQTPAPTPVPTATPAPTAEPTVTPEPDPNATATPEPTRDPSLPAAIPVQTGTWDTAEDDTVTRIQKRLNELNYLFGAADGKFGAQSAEAVRAFQTANGLNATGIVDGETYRALFAKKIVRGPEPTPTPYAPTGVVDDAWKTDVMDDGFEVYQQHMERGSAGAEVRRLQTRLTQLWYYGIGIDSQYGGATERAVSYFQKRNSLPETGIADEATQRALFSESAVKSDRPATPYKLVIDVSEQRVYAYEWVNGKYDHLVRTMICSTGLKDTPTPIGSWKAGGPCGRWYFFKKFDCWAQYAYRINGPILFHSVIYSERDTATLRQSSVNNLGRRASHGCVRLKVEDAKWIYNNCPAGTTVTVQN